MKVPKKNVLLVYPEIPKNTYWSFQYALPFIGKRTSMPPLGLITVAALFPDDCSLRLVDMNVEALEDRDILWADAVFVSAMIVQQGSFQIVVEACNRLGRPVVAGGPYPTTSHETIEGVDHFVAGEAEDIFAEFWDDFQKGKAKKIYSPPSRPNLSRPVIPRFDLLKLDAYACMSVQYSRGCPFNCEFCDIWMIYGNRSRVKPAKNVVREIDTLYRLGWRSPVFIVDDNFIGNKRAVKRDLLPALTRWQEEHGFAYRFFTEASINLADDDELVEDMVGAGFNEVFIGVETPSEKSLRETKKFHNLKSDMFGSIRKLQNSGLEVMGGFVLGFDSDEKDIFDRQIEFIEKAGIPKAMIGILIALPQTRLLERLEREGRLLKASDGNNTHSLETNFVTRMDPETLRQGYRKVLETLYDHNLKNYFRRCSTCLDNIGHTEFYNRPVGFEDVKALFRSLFFQTFTPYGFQYWKFIVRNIMKNPDKFGETVRMAIQGHHFRTITQELLKVDRVDSALRDGYLAFLEYLSQYSELVKTNSGEALGQLYRQWDETRTCLKEIRARIDGIHRDFRGDALEKYREISEEMKTTLEGCEKEVGTSTVGEKLVPG